MDSGSNPPSGDPVADIRGFRECLGQYVTGVTVMTAEHEGALVGMTVNSFASLSLDPPLILWSIRKNSTSLDTFRAAPNFVVNVLASDQIAVSQQFAVSGDVKFDGIVYERGIHGQPLLAGSAATLECSLEAEHDGGDHYLLVGRVNRFRRHDRQPLVFKQGRYAATIEHPSGGNKLGDNGASPNLPWAVLFRQAYADLNEAIDAMRSSAGLTFNQGRLLSAILEHPGLSAEALVPLSLVEYAAAQDAISALCAKGFIARSGTGLKITASGAETLNGLLRKVAAIEDSLLEGCSKEEVLVARRVLAKLIRSAEHQVAN
ncbi:MAG: flavin reductase [Rhodobiaceae bacterium]|nr:flavin reductase [Rhodobiaceae bacterium]